jgi:CRP-like cAMP-binding protein
MIESEYLKDNIGFVKKLGQMPTLKPFDEKDLKGLLGLSKIKKYEPGELILKDGFYDNWIYFLVSGKVRIVKHEEELSILKRTGDIFGEMSIIDASPRSASVYAVDETVCLASDASHMDRLTGKDKLAFCYVLYRLFAEVLANRLRLTSEELIQVKEENKRLRSNDKNKG